MILADIIPYHILHYTGVIEKLNGLFDFKKGGVIYLVQVYVLNVHMLRDSFAYCGSVLIICPYLKGRKTFKVEIRGKYE